MAGVMLYWQTVGSGPYSSVGFFKFEAVPMYEAFAEVFHDAGHPLLHFCKANMQVMPPNPPITSQPPVSYCEYTMKTRSIGN